ncbi:phosphonate ABC transporter, ATP-binding protein [Mycobacterium [tuberculosis] TKK-01-0051]|uniref:Phosphonate ABC transporter, ATP-binding protein n=1 Tax=Mycobacterium [tuberculosis] TKK-01-0051 TaxID=1324261 RepID=A0A051TWH5_9MYCO|nr:phosphonate ABC transporter ATP-binding protein [Mycobacterium colombiense]KBZ60726.1 phosphonate ABC transporter, ATP-binding protein [Mycobacterium [tuberculosis] TKK-01-0051]
MIQLYDVSVRYEATIALHPLTVGFPAGSFTVLLGPSGAGKSTLLRCMNHLVIPTGGFIEVAGIGTLNSSSRVRAHRRRTGMIFQQHQLIGRHTALRNALLGCVASTSVLHGFWRTNRTETYRALAALDRVGLLTKAMVRADRLSGGEQQRVGIARALTQQPDIVLADEPVASLDPETAISVLSMLREICRQDGITAVVSLHQVELARRFADRIVGLSAGRVIADAPPSQINSDQIDRIYRRTDNSPTAPTAKES